MGSSYSSLCPPSTRCEPALSSSTNLQSNNNNNNHHPHLPHDGAENDNTAAASSPPPPPKLGSTETIEQKMWRKFSKQPLVPIGCVATAYFLASGIKSFRDRDPVRSQRMMKARVMAQFATLMCFMGYLGWEKLDFRIMPLYQDVKKVEAYYNNNNNNNNAMDTAEQAQQQDQNENDNSRSSSSRRKE